MSPTAVSSKLLAFSCFRVRSRGKRNCTAYSRHISRHLDNRLQLFSLRAHPSYLPTYATTEIIGQVAIRPADKGGWSIVFFARTTGSCVRGRPHTLSWRIGVSHANYPSCPANGFRGLLESVPADKAQIFRN